MKAESKNPLGRFFRAVVTVVIWVGAGVTICGLAAKHVPSDPLWMLQLIAIVLPYLAWLSIPATLLAVAMRRKRLVGVQVVILLWLVIRFWPGSVDAVDESAHLLSLVSYNSPYPQSRISPENEAEFQAILDEFEPNIVGFQETFLGFLNRGGERIVGRGDVMNVFGPAGFEIARPNPDEEILFYQPVLSNFPVDTTRKIILPDSPFPIESEIVRVRFRWEGSPVVFYNIHLASYGASKPWNENNSSVLSAGFWFKYLRQYRQAIKARAWEAERLREMIDKETDPVIIVGDFNATRHNWSYTRVRGSMTDVLRESREGLRMSYHARYPFARIDHILISDAFVPVSSRVLSTTRSDHRAVWAEIAFAR